MSGGGEWKRATAPNSCGSGPGFRMRKGTCPTRTRTLLDTSGWVGQPRLPMTRPGSTCGSDRTAHRPRLGTGSARPASQVAQESIISLTVLRWLTAGESHGPQLTVVVEGLPAGLELTADDLRPDLRRRQGGHGRGGRQQIEVDEARILGGVRGGLTIGSPVALALENREHASWGTHTT